MLESVLILFLTQAPVVKPSPDGAAVVRLPSQIQAQPGQPFAVVAEGNLKWTRWTIPSGLVRVPPELTAAGEKAFVGYGPAGVYEFKVEGTLNDQFAEAKCVVFVGQPLPGPGPGPEPKPPDDPLFAELQQFYRDNADPNKLAHVRSLASLYSTAGQAALKDTTVASTGQFLAKLKAAAKILLPDDALPKIRTRLAAEFATCLGTADVALTPELRTKASECLGRLATLLEALR